MLGHRSYLTDVTVEAQAAALELIRWAINTGRSHQDPDDPERDSAGHVVRDLGGQGYAGRVSDRML